MSDVEQLDAEKQEVLEQIGRRIRRARERAGLTQEELATQIGKTQKAISGYEKGTRAIRITEVPELARALAVAPGYFLGSEEIDTKEVLKTAYSQLLPVFQRIVTNIMQQLVIIQNHAVRENSLLADPNGASLDPRQVSASETPVWNEGSGMLSHTELFKSGDRVAHIISTMHVSIPTLMRTRSIQMWEDPDEADYPDDEVK